MKMETVRIPNRATRLPLALTDVTLSAPLISRLLLRSTLPGNLLGAAAIGAYAGSALRDWLTRRRVRPIDFVATFGVDLLSPPAMPRQAREREIDELVSRLNALYEPPRMTRRVRAIAVDAVLTDYIATVTGQRVETSVEVRNFMIPQLIFPFALGACDILSGDIALFRDTGIFEPHVLAHEFSHRKGYLREVEAQVLSYLALTSSAHTELVQSALSERLFRQLVLASGRDREHLWDAIESTDLEPQLKSAFAARSPNPSTYERLVGPMMQRVYDSRMRLTGQNGLSDYDEGFTNALFAIESRPLPAVRR